MNTRNDQTRDLIELIVCILIILGEIALVNHSDNTILAKREAFQILSNSLLPKGEPFDQDEMRISHLFVEDTLPRLMQYGLIKKYELTQFRTILFVNGPLWKQTSPFFKNCLLREILAHNKINGYAPETQIVDNQSRRLFAKISPSFAFTFFD